MTDETTIEMTTRPQAAPQDELAIRMDDIGSVLTLKEGSLFLLTDRSGDIPPQVAPGGNRGMGMPVGL